MYFINYIGGNIPNYYINHSMQPIIHTTTEQDIYNSKDTYNSYLQDCDKLKSNPEYHYL